MNEFLLSFFFIFSWTFFFEKNEFLPRFFFLRGMNSFFFLNNFLTSKWQFDWEGRPASHQIVGLAQLWPNMEGPIPVSLLSLSCRRRQHRERRRRCADRGKKKTPRQRSRGASPPALPRVSQAVTADSSALRSKVCIPNFFSRFHGSRPYGFHSSPSANNRPGDWG